MNNVNMRGVHTEYCWMRLVIFCMGADHVIRVPIGCQTCAYCMAELVIAGYVVMITWQLQHGESYIVGQSPK